MTGYRSSPREKGMSRASKPPSRTRSILGSAAGSAAREGSQRIMSELFGAPAERDFDVRYWDGTAEAAPHTSGPSFTLVLRTPCALRTMLLAPTERSLGESYVRGDFDVEGDLEAATALGATIRDRCRSPRRFVRIAAMLRSLPTDRTRESGINTDGFRPVRLNRTHSLRRDGAAVRFHYDVGNDFYQLFLDSRMVYSCAYFHSPADDLETAQQAKLEHICRKLDLRPGERLLDIGCGWGGLVEYAASRFGVEAVGITLSPRQAEVARQRIAAAGLDERCRVMVQDYRALPRDARFDKIVSVGMIEHVGRAKLRRYFDSAFRRLEPGGLFLNQGIVTLESTRRLRRILSKPLRRWSSFIERHVFPDSELVNPSEMLGPAEAIGFEIRDVENLREHYALTLRHWVQRLESNATEAVACAGERVWRTWRLYMAGSAQAFATGRIAVLQMLLARPRSHGVVALPLTREHLYAAHRASSRLSTTHSRAAWHAVHSSENGDAGQ